MDTKTQQGSRNDECLEPMCDNDNGLSAVTSTPMSTTHDTYTAIQPTGSSVEGKIQD